MSETIERLSNKLIKLEAFGSKGFKVNHLESQSDGLCASVEHYGVQPVGCMDNEPEPYRGVPC